MLQYATFKSLRFTVFPMSIGQSVEITADERGSSAAATENKSNNEDDDEEVEPSVLQALSSEQLARRPSFK